MPTLELLSESQMNYYNPSNEGQGFEVTRIAAGGLSLQLGEIKTDSFPTAEEIDARAPAETGSCYSNCNCGPDPR